MQFAIVAINRGGRDAHGVVMSDLVPDHLTVVAASTTKGIPSILHNDVVIDIGVVAPGQQVTAMVSGIVKDGPTIGTIENCAQLSFDEVEMTVSCFSFLLRGASASSTLISPSSSSSSIRPSQLATSSLSATLPLPLARPVANSLSRALRQSWMPLSGAALLGLSLALHLSKKNAEKVERPYRRQGGQTNE